MEINQKNDVLYQSSKNWAKLFYIFAGITIVLFSISILFNSLLVYASHISSDAGVHLFIYNMSVLIPLLSIGSIIPLYLFFLIWIYRIYKNLSVLGAKNLRMTPGWAVGWYFIPIVRYWKTYQGLKDAWNACSLNLDFDEKKWSDRKGATIIKWWTLIYLSIEGATNGLSRFMFRGETYEDYMTSARAIIALSVIYLIHTIVLIILVKRLTDRQEQKWKQVQTNTL